MSLNQIRIEIRLGAGFAAVLAVSALIVGFGAWRLSVAADEAARMMAIPLAKERHQ